MRPQPASRNRQGRQSGARRQRRGSGPAATGPPVGRGVGKSQPPRRLPPPPHRPDRGPSAPPPRAGRGREELPPPSRSEAGATTNPSAPQPGPTPAWRRGTAAHRSPQLPPRPELGGERGGRVCAPHPGRPLPVRDGQGTYPTHLRRSPPRCPARSEEGVKSSAPFLRYGLR